MGHLGSAFLGMTKKLLTVLSLFFLSAAAIAQGPPPAMDDATWQVAEPPPPGEAGPPAPLPFFFKPEFVGFDGDDEHYKAKLTDENGQPITGEDHDGNGEPDPIYCDIYVLDLFDGEICEVYNSDSGLWTLWIWCGGYYEKVGGTKHQRSYHPIPNN